MQSCLQTVEVKKLLNLVSLENAVLNQILWLNLIVHTGLGDV